MSPQSKPLVLRAKFQNLKLPIFGKCTTVKCTLEVELRSTRSHPELFYLFWVFNGRPVKEDRFFLESGKRAAADMFEKQVSDWVSVESARP
jgi:hypothetical protein